MNPKKYKNKSESYDIEYSVKTMILRLSIVIIIFLFLLFIGMKFFMNYNQKDIVLPENYIEDYDSNLKTLYVVENKSYGDFKSLDEKIVVQGYLKIEFDKNISYVSFREFKITKGSDYRPALSRNMIGSSTIFLSEKLLGTVGDQRYKIPDKIDFNEHKYFIIWDISSNKAISYALLK